MILVLKIGRGLVNSIVFPSKIQYSPFVFIHPNNLTVIYLCVLKEYVKNATNDFFLHIFVY